MRELQGEDFIDKRRLISVLLIGIGIIMLLGYCSMTTTTPTQCAAGYTYTQSDGQCTPSPTRNMMEWVARRLKTPTNSLSFCWRKMTWQFVNSCSFAFLLAIAACSKRAIS